MKKPHSSKAEVNRRAHTGAAGDFLDAASRLVAGVDYEELGHSDVDEDQRAILGLCERIADETMLELRPWGVALRRAVDAANREFDQAAALEVRRAQAVGLVENMLAEVAAGEPPHQASQVLRSQLMGTDPGFIELLPGDIVEDLSTWKHSAAGLLARWADLHVSVLELERPERDDGIDPVERNRKLLDKAVRRQQSPQKTL
ncbi:MAG: hypothetical protein IT377_27750 [Polyangiaceae bacterium]|nr:hypothetical protein [Polyangiaceae bacterium]